MLRNSPNAATAAQATDSADIRVFWQKLLLDHLGGAAAKVRDMMERRRQRLALRELDSRLLRDVGISRADVWQECSKSSWQH